MKPAPPVIRTFMRVSSGKRVPSSESVPIADENHAAAAAVDLEGDLARAAQCLADRLLAIGRCVQQQEAAAARAEELAAGRGGLARRLVPVVDGGARDTEAERTLEQPALVKKARELFEVALAADLLAHGGGQIAHLFQHGKTGHRA